MASKRRLTLAPVWLLYLTLPPECPGSDQLVQVPLKRRIGRTVFEVDLGKPAVQDRVVLRLHVLRGPLVNEAAEKEPAVEPLGEVDDRFSSFDAVESERERVDIGQVPLDPVGRVLVVGLLGHDREDTGQGRVDLSP